MNAVILLVWFAGADGAAPAAKPVFGQAPATPAQAQPAPKPAPGHAPPPPPHVYPAPVSAGCNDCCDTGGHRLFGKLRGLFHRCDDGCKTDCGPHGQIHHRYQDTCCDEGGHKLFGFLHRWRDRDCCEESLCDKLRGRLHGIFRKHDDCCPTDCCAPGVHGAPPMGVRPQPEPAPAPKKLQPMKPAGEKAPEKLPSTKKTELNNSQPPSVFSLQPPVLNERR